jgi:ABC-type multidrug transport system ATPase subunit
VALARAFLGDPQVLLLDEPLSGLYRRWRDELWTSVLGSGRAERTTVLTLHTLEEVGDIPRTVLVWGGRVVFDGPTAEAAESTGPFQVATLDTRVPVEALERVHRDGRLVAWRSVEDGVEVLVPGEGTEPLLDRLRQQGIDGVDAGRAIPFLTQVRNAA